MNLSFRKLAMTALLIVGIMMAALPANALTKYNQGGTPGKSTNPAMKGTYGQVTYSTAQFQGRTIYRTTENNPAGHPLTQSVRVTYILWRFNDATQTWVKESAVARSASLGTGGASVAVSGTTIQLQHRGYYSADVKVEWIGDSGTVIGKALYRYDLVADYSCNCTTWQGTGVAAMYL